MYFLSPVLSQSSPHSLLLQFPLSDKKKKWREKYYHWLFQIYTIPQLRISEPRTRFCDLHFHSTHTWLHSLILLVTETLIVLPLAVGQPMSLLVAKKGVFQLARLGSRAHPYDQGIQRLKAPGQAHCQSGGQAAFQRERSRVKPHQKLGINTTGHTKALSVTPALAYLSWKKKSTLSLGLYSFPILSFEITFQL